MSHRDPVAALEAMERDKLDAQYAIELLLDRYAQKHGINQGVIGKAVSGYVEDMLGDIFFEVQEELERERDEAPEIG